MSLFSWLGSVFRGGAAAPVVKASGFDVAAHNEVAFGGSGGGSGPTRSTVAVLGAVRDSPWERATVGKIATAVATTPLRLYALRTQQGKYRRAHWAGWASMEARRKEARKAELRGEMAEEVMEHPFFDLLGRPNAYLTGFHLLYLMEAWYETTGLSLVAMLRGPPVPGAPRGLPVELWPVPPNCVSHVPTPDGRFRTYRFWMYGRAWELPPEDVLDMRDPSLLSPYDEAWGTSATLADELYADEQAARREGAFYANGGLPNAIITLEGASRDNLREAKAKMEASHRGVWNAFRSFWTDRKVAVERLDTSFRDNEMPTLRRMHRDTIRQVRGVPPEKLGITDQSNKATIDGSDLVWGKDVILPRLERNRSSWLLRLAQEWDSRLWPEFDSPVAEDKDFRLEVMKAFPTNFFRNEVRVLAGADPVSGGDSEPAVTPASTPSTSKAEDPPWAKHLSRQVLPAQVKGWEEALAALKGERLSVALSPIFLAKVQEWGRQVLTDLGVAPRFDLLNPLIPQHVREVAGERVQLINTTTLDSLRATLEEGVRAGEDVRALSNRVREVFTVATKQRATVIARTEVVRSSNWATWQAHKASGVVDKRRWVATADSRTRSAHRAINGQERGVDEAFVHGGREAMYPGGFGVAALDVQCRCTTVAVIEDPEVEEDSFRPGAGGAVVRIHPGGEVPYTTLWKAYDEALLTWESEVGAALRQAFQLQELDVLSALSE